MIGLGVLLEQIPRDELLIALIAFELPDANVDVANVDPQIQFRLKRPSAELANAGRTVVVAAAAAVVFD